MSHYDPQSFKAASSGGTGRPTVAFSQAFHRMVARSTIGSHDIEIATAAEIMTALSLTRQLFPVASDEVVRRILSHNPECFRIVRQGASTDSPMAAFLPLNAEGVAALVDGRFDGQAPSLQFICRPGEKPEAIYSWLTYAPGKMVAGLRLLLELDRIGGGVPVFTRAAHDEAARILETAGFVSARSLFPSAPEWLIVALAQQPSDGRKLTVRVARTLDDIGKVMTVRALTYMTEQLCTYAEEFDGNDFCGTHFLGEVGGEPAGCVRIRYFAEFAKMERLAVVPKYRDTRLMWRLVQTAFDHCARKGYRTMYAHAREDMAPTWERLGARPVEGRPGFSFSDVRFREMVLDLAPHSEALGLSSDPMVLIRPEGEWDRLGPIDRAQLRIHAERASYIEGQRA